ncbi:MAG TPA: hypothetical protein VMG37_01560 [Solirubrobacteraceae bacterium]|nr:hypothetical protein [Solirubrobacteraceae bacterium]
MLLAIYLNDHFAGATAGRELVRRAAASNRGTAYGPFLDELAREIAEDRDALRRIMRALNVRVDPMKVAAGWSAEKLGRLKLNGRLRGYSPLSRVVELEALALGVRGKLAGWHTLETVQDERSIPASPPLAELIARAERQLEALESHRRRAAAEAFEAPN